MGAPVPILHPPSLKTPAILALFRTHPQVLFRMAISPLITATAVVTRIRIRIHHPLAH